MRRLASIRPVKIINTSLFVNGAAGFHKRRKSLNHRAAAKAFAVLLFCCSQFFQSILASPTGYAAAASAFAESRQALTLRVDTEHRARAFSAGLPVVINIASYFEFYERNLTGSRKRIFEGPWYGYLREDVPGTYGLTGADSKTGASYNVVFRQIDHSAVELLMSFQAPSRPSSLGFDVVKLYADLFKGASIETTPSVSGDAAAIPVQPRHFNERVMLKNKDRVRLRGAFCDLEISDLSESKTMYVADGRNVPWDDHKSILFGAEAHNLLPNGCYSFRYLIQAYPPTRTDILAQKLALGLPVPDIDTWSFYALTPKEEIKAAGQYQLRQGDSIYGTPNGTAESVLHAELARKTSIHHAIRQPDSEKSIKGFYIEKAPDGALPHEGFEIVITPEKIVVRGADERGCLYGVYAVMGRLSRDQAGVWTLGSAVIRDWPDLPLRGVCMELLPPAIRDVAIAKRYLDAFSKARSNVVAFLHNPPQIRAWLRNRDDGGWTREQMVEIARYARSLHMDVWGAMGSGFSASDFPELEIKAGSNLYNPFDQKSYDYLFALYHKILGVYKPSTLLISHDEIKGLSNYAAGTDKSTADILAMDVLQIHQWLGKHDVRMAIWGDMLLDHHAWESAVGSANSRNPAFNSGATHEALKQLPKDILILDWHYDEKENYPSIDYFRRNGFNVLGASWHNAKAAKSFATSVKHYNGQGVLATDWGFWATLSPASTTLFVPLCAWSTTCSIEKDNRDVNTLAGTVRDPVYQAYSPLQAQVSLKTSTNAKASSLHGTSGKGLFNLGPLIDLSGFQTGRQVLGGVNFEILPDERGQQNNCVIVGNNVSTAAGMPCEQKVFQGSMHAQALAFLQTSFVEEPQSRVRSIGAYKVEYATGRSETIHLLENWNITDIRSAEGLRRNGWNFLRSPDVLIGSRPAWRGMSAADIQLNVQMFIWKNPFPKENIKSISLDAVNAPPNTQIALLGLTVLH